MELELGTGLFYIPAIAHRCVRVHCFEKVAALPAHFVGSGRRKKSSKARSAQRAILSDYACRRDVVTGFRCLPTNDPVLGAYCPQIDKALHECAQLCNEHPRCAAFVHNKRGMCWMHDKVGTPVPETNPVHGTRHCSKDIKR